MGGHPYWYFVPYQPDLQKALDALREREFKAGRYNPVISFLEFSEPAFSKQKPGAKHRSIDEAMEAADADGTRSILDIARIGARADFCVAAPIAPSQVVEACGSAKPRHADIESGLSALLEGIARGHCGYVLVYENDAPHEIWFGGYSFD